MNRNKLAVIVFAGLLFTTASCTTVKGYQKNRINDSEMQLATRRVQKTEVDFEGIREGASGANGGKTGGGCGCN